MKRSLFLTLIATVWLSVGVAFAQTDVKTQPDVDNKVVPPRLAVKWSAFHLLYFYPSLQFSIEHKLWNALNIQYEAGWVLHSKYSSTDYSDKRGYRAAVELRYYVPSPPITPFYLSAEFYYHNVRFDRSETVGFNCELGECDYYQFVTYPVEVEELGPALKFGMLVFPAWRRNKSFFFDINSGVAYRNINYSYSLRPAGQNLLFLREESDWNPFTPDEEITEKFRFVLGLRFCYRFL